MNRFELREALDAKGVNPGWYSLPDVYPNAVGGGGVTVLETRGPGWVVYGVDDRGQDFDYRYFATEDDACQYMYEQLSRLRPPAGRQATPEEVERARALAAERQAEYEAWLISQGRDPKTGELTNLDR